MSFLKTVSAVAVLSAAIAAPAFGQDVYQSYRGAPYGYGYARDSQPYYRNYDVPPGSYAPRNNEEYRNQENFGFSGRDPSRVGGVSPNLNPSS
jgi:hypothetical protein